MAYSDPNTGASASYTVHIDIADWTFRGTDGAQMVAAVPLWQDALVAAASDPSGPWIDPIDAGGQSSDSYFKTVLTALPSSAGGQITVTSDTASSDTFTDTLSYAGNVATSVDYAALYNGDAYLANDPTTLTSAQEAAIHSNLMLNVVHNDTAKEVLTTQQDKQERDMPKVGTIQFTGLTSDVVTQGTVIQGTATPTNPQQVGVTTVDLMYQDGTTVGSTSILDHKINEPFTFTLTNPGFYWLEATGLPVLGADEPIFSKGSFTILVDNKVVGSPYKKAAWEAVQVNGLGSQSPDSIGRNRRITELYANMYNGNHAFRWPAIAAFASKAVGDAIGSASAGATAASIAELLGWDEIPILGKTDTLRQMLSAMDNLLGQGNFAVFMDIYPTFLAYTDSNGQGLQNVTQLFQANLIGQPLLAAWKTIDAGIKSNDQTKLWQGVRDMFYYEQRSVLQAVAFEPNRALWTNFTQNFGSRLASGIPGALPFITVVPGGDFGSAADRIAAFDKDWFPKFQKWVEANPGNIDARTLLAGGYNS